MSHIKNNKLITPQGIQSEINPNVIFDKSFSESIQIRNELKTLSKFSTHITPIECDTDDEKELKDKLEEIILSDIENKIRNKVNEFTVKLIASTRNNKRNKIGTNVFREPKVGNTIIGKNLEQEEGWYLGGTTKELNVKVDKERLDQLKRNATHLELKYKNNNYPDMNQNINFDKIAEKLVTPHKIKYTEDKPSLEVEIKNNKTATSSYPSLEEMKKAFFISEQNEAAQGTVEIKNKKAVKKKSTKKKSVKNSGKKKSTKKKTSKKGKTNARKTKTG